MTLKRTVLVIALVLMASCSIKKDFSSENEISCPLRQHLGVDHKLEDLSSEDEITCIARQLLEADRKWICGYDFEDSGSVVAGIVFLFPPDEDCGILSCSSIKCGEGLMTNIEIDEYGCVHGTLYADGQENDFSCI